MLTFIGCKRVLKDVRHVLDIWLNIISAGKFDDEAYRNSLVKENGSLLKAR